MGSIGNDEENTGEKAGTPYKVGPGNPPLETRFGNRPQPDPEKQKKTKAERRYARERIHRLLNLKINLNPVSAAKAQLIEAYGKNVLHLPQGDLLILRAIHKGILSGDGSIGIQLLNQIHGTPKQTQEISGLDGVPLTTVINVISVDKNLPDIKENEDDD